MFAEKRWHYDGMSSDAARFARIVLEAFETAGRTSDSSIAAAGGPSTSTMTKLRHAAKGSGTLAEPRSQTWAAIERAANWPTGSARRVWAGGDPPEIKDIVPVEPLGEDFVQFEITGNFGVRAIVKGPIRDIDALQAAALKLAAGLSTETEASTESATP